MKPYADTNFFTRVYLQLPGSEEARSMLDQAAGEGKVALLPITFLHRLELVNALQLYVYLARTDGAVRVTPEHAAAAQAIFRENLADGGYLKVAPLEKDELLRGFEEISFRHTAKHGFRTYDILHVASALLLGCDTFWSFDAKAKKLAKLEGLKVL